MRARKEILRHGESGGEHHCNQSPRVKGGRRERLMMSLMVVVVVSYFFIEVILRVLLRVPRLPFLQSSKHFLERIPDSVTTEEEYWSSWLPSFACLLASLGGPWVHPRHPGLILTVNAVYESV